MATSASEQKAEMLKGISAREHKRTLQQLKFAAGFIAGRSRTARRAERAIQATLLRCLFGNPFRPSAPLPHAVLAWNDGTVRRIAEGIYQERAFNRMPVLADALLDAGCEDEALFQHCREPGSHVRGCWAVDLILGKS